MPFCTLAYFSASPYSCTPLAIVLSSLFYTLETQTQDIFSLASHTFTDQQKLFFLIFFHCVLFCMTVVQTEYVSFELLDDRKQFCEFPVRATDFEEQSSGRRYVRSWQVDWLQKRQVAWQKGVQTGRPARAVWPWVSRHKDNKDKWLVLKYEKQELKNCGGGEGYEGKHQD